VSFGLSVEGDLLAQVSKFKQQAEGEFKTAVNLTAIGVLGDAVKSIQRGSKTGRTYTYDSTSSDKYTTIKDGDNIVKVIKNNGRNGTHQASAPGEAPASDTGRLAGDLAIVVTGLTATVGTALEYGKYLEYGTMKIEERPWLRPALDRNRKLFVDRIKLAIKEAKK
jgi:HK97 gp10 family phage protein